MSSIKSLEELEVGMITETGVEYYGTCHLDKVYCHLIKRPEDNDKVRVCTAQLFELFVNKPLKLRYFYHPESESLFRATYENNQEILELDEEQYYLRALEKFPEIKKLLDEKLI